MKDFYMDGHLNQELADMRRIIKKDWDFIFLVDGPEGAGKSVFAMQIAKRLDPTFNLDRMAFSATQFVNQVNKAEKYQAIIFDEALRGLSSRSSMTRTNRIIVKLLAEIRQKNLFGIIVLPTFFDLDRNIAIWRSCMLLHVYTKDNLQRGFFVAYDYDKKKNLYLIGKKFYSYGGVKMSFHGRFYNQYVVDEQEYRALKLKNLTQQSDDVELGARYQLQLRSLMKYLHEDEKFTYDKIKEGINLYSGLNLTVSAIHKAVSRFDPENPNY